MASITVMKDLVQMWEMTSDVPALYGGSSPTWNEYKGSSTVERVGGGSDNPNEEAVSQEIQDGREVQASVEMAFAQMIFEADGTDTIYDMVKTAADGNKNLWLRRTGEQAEAGPEIIGGQLGLTATIAKNRPNSEGARLFVVNFTAAGALGGTTIEEDTTGS